MFNERNTRPEPNACAVFKITPDRPVETSMGVLQTRLYKWLCLKQGVHRTEKKAEKIRNNLYKLHEKGWIVIGTDIHIDNPSRSDLTRVADQRFTQPHPTKKRKRKMLDQWYWIYGCGISAGRAEAQPREGIVRQHGDVKEGSGNLISLTT